jgi:hypothetical protein
MLTVQVKLSVEDIIGSLNNLDEGEREKLQYALYDLQNDAALDEAIKEAREDVRNGKLHSHEDVTREIKAKYLR